MDEEAEELSFTVPPAGAERLDAWLAGVADGFSRSRIQGLMKAGNVLVDGEPVSVRDAKLKPGSIVTLCVPPPVPADPEPENIPLDILFEDDDILVLNKPAGLVVHPAPGHYTGTLVNALLFHCPDLKGIGGVARPGIVHRLDQDTSGVMIVAKSERAMRVLVKEFASHANMAKTYLALVHGVPVPLEGRIENEIGRSPFDRKKMAIVERNGKRAVTRYRTLKTIGPLSLVQCDIETGRTHQIRVHMRSLGTPVAGDALYGFDNLDRQLVPPPARQMLHAWRLGLRHPVSREGLLFEAPPPQAFLPFLP